MKRSIIGILLFIFTFVLGCVLASLNGPREESVSPPPLIDCARPTESPTPVQMPNVAVSKVDDFIPEFTGLTDFAGLGYSEFKMKLVDIHEHENAYRKSEVIAKNGEEWLGLFERDGKFYLQDTRVKVKLDPSYEGYGDEDYVRLTTSDKGNPVFILRNTKSLRPGPVESLYLKPTYEEIERRRLNVKPLSVGYDEYFSIGDNEFRLRVSRGLTRENEKVVVLTLSMLGNMQPITYTQYFSDIDTVGQLLWAGDLDRDGKLDLYIDHSGNDSCGFASSLFLSSAAKNVELVRQVAAFGTAGC